MTLQQKGALTGQAIKLFTLGLEVERRRKKLHRLVAGGVPYRSPKMREALDRFLSAEREWRELEQRHLTLRGILMERRYETE